MMLRSILSFFQSCGLLSGRDKGGREMSIATPDGAVVAKMKEVERFPQKINVCQGEELQRLIALDNGANEFLRHYLPNVQKPELKDFDSAFLLWQRDRTPPYSNQQIIDLLGSYLGNRCIADFNMEWVIVSDKYGTNHAIRSRTVEVMSFPFESVRKRIDRNEHDFMYGIYYTMQQMISSDKYKERVPATNEVIQSKPLE